MNISQKGRSHIGLLKLSGDQECANQDHSEILSLHSFDWQKARNQTILSVGEEKEQQTLSYTTSGHHIWQSHLGKQCALVYKVEHSCVPQLPSHPICTLHQDTWTGRLTEQWCSCQQQARNPHVPIDFRIDTQWWSIYRAEYYPAVKMDSLQPRVETYTSLSGPYTESPSKSWNHHYV